MQYSNPFVGLKAFEETDDYLFFGRAKEIDDLLKKFSNNRFLAVIGSSGSGKSSLVKSGMLPNIYGGFMKAGSNWRVALMQPGENPIGYLAKELAREGILYTDINNAEIPYESVIESRLRRSENGLQHVYTDARLPADENLLIVVDQFEELFRFSKYEKDHKLGKSDAMQFIQVLLTASQQKEYPIYVLLTMRSDFLGDCSEFRGLPEAINDGQYLVPRMTREGIREAITGPVAVSGATISQRLVTRLLNDINNDTDQLPILQHAMMRTWEAWYKKNQLDTPIDFEDYETIGTMKTALSLHADEAYGELDSEKKQLTCELIFKALTDTSADLRGIRRPRSITDLCILAGASQEQVKSLIEIFRKPGRTFLMPPCETELQDDTIVDISHESLMRVWNRLVTWTDEEARSGDLYMRLAASAQLYTIGQRGWLKDPELGIALRWKEQNKLTSKWAEGFIANFEQTMSYLEESRIKDLEEKKIIAKKESTRRRLIKTIFGLLGLLVIAGIIASFIFNNKRKEAELAKKEALYSKRKAEIAKDNAIQSENFAQASLIKATESDSIAQLARDTALIAKAGAEKSAAIARLKELEANKSEKKAEAERDIAEQLKKEATENAYKNAPSEYARLVREGPLNLKEIRDSAFDFKLAAYTWHLDELGRKIKSTDDRDAVSKYNNLMSRLYYNNDLYAKIYACFDNITNPNAKKVLFRNVDSFNGKIQGDLDRNDPAFKIMNREIQLTGKKEILKLLEDKQDQRIICSTDDNWIIVYSSSSKAIENKIPMGAKVTALEYNPSKKIIYFGLESGNIGFIKYGKDKKNQPVFENLIGSPVIALQLFEKTINGSKKHFLLAAGKKSKVVVYDLNENSLQPDKNLLGNILPEKNLGELTGAQYDEKMQLVIIRGRSLRSASATYFRWNPFTVLALEEYKKYKNDPGFINSTKIY